MVYCPNCGSRCEDKSNFCSHCGQKLKNDHAPEWMPRRKRTAYTQKYGVLDVYADDPKVCPKCKKDSLRQADHFNEEIDRYINHKGTKEEYCKFQGIWCYECVACGYYLMYEDHSPFGTNDLSPDFYEAKNKVYKSKEDFEKKRR